ncbi:hypothetical protein [Streptomyces sp. NPDC001985]|uniref:hypothetical protein n=1 Tax=Streptomyces sp. NPDC001985 TaxID=3154406 RepID=UPI00331F3820
MYEEYDPYGSPAPHPDQHGYVPWEETYVPSPVESVAAYQPMGPPVMETLDGVWDPTEELEQLLQNSGVHEFDGLPGHGRKPEPMDVPLRTGLLGPPAEAPPRPPAPHRRRRRPPNRGPKFLLARAISFSIAALAAVIVSMVSVLGGMVALDPLRSIADPRLPQTLIHWWPLLVYGPWIVASLSILRASLHRRRAVHSWSVVLIFSTVATLLCITQAPRTLTAAAAAALPSIAALACFQQLVRLITMVRPPRQVTARHRHTVPPPPPPADRRPAGDHPVKPQTPVRAPLSEPDRTIQLRRPPEQGAFPRRPQTRHGEFL